MSIRPVSSLGARETPHRVRSSLPWSLPPPIKGDIGKNENGVIVPLRGATWTGIRMPSQTASLRAAGFPRPLRWTPPRLLPVTPRLTRETSRSIAPPMCTDGAPIRLSWPWCLPVMRWFPSLPWARSIRTPCRSIKRGNRLWRASHVNGTSTGIHAFHTKPRENGNNTILPPW